MVRFLYAVFQKNKMVDLIEVIVEFYPTLSTENGCKTIHLFFLLQTSNYFSPFRLTRLQKEFPNASHSHAKMKEHAWKTMKMAFTASALSSIEESIAKVYMT